MPSTALLIMDLQVGNTSQLNLPPTYLPLIATTLATARAHSIQVIYVTISFRPGHPEISPSNAVFYAASKKGLFVAGSPETQIDPSIAPLPSDIIVEKKRVSAFTGSGLDLILSSLGVKKLVMFGIATGGVVLSTLSEAADRDFEIVVLEDLCLDRDEETHRLLVEKIFKKRGQVIGAAEWAAGLERDGKPAVEA